MANGTSNPARANIQVLLFGFFVSLTVKAGLDAAYGGDTGLGKAQNLWALWAVVWHTQSLQLIAFLFTLMRFIYGAYRVQEEAKDLEHWVLLWVVAGMLILFVLFYMTGLCMRNAAPFYTCLAAAHVWDLACFIIPAAFSDKLHNNELKQVMRRFMIIDILTVLALVASIFLYPSTLHVTGLVIMATFGLLDFAINHRFFFPP